MVAQSVEQRTFNPLVEGSSPSHPTNNQRLTAFKPLKRLVHTEYTPVEAPAGVLPRKSQELLRGSMIHAGLERRGFELVLFAVVRLVSSYSLGSAIKSFGWRPHFYRGVISAAN